MTFPIVGKIMKDLMREKTFVFALLLQVLLILSISVILGYTSLFFSPESLIVNQVKIGVMNGAEMNDLIAEDKNSDMFLYNDFDLAKKELINGEIDALLVGEVDKIPYVYKVYLPESQIQSSVIMAILKDKFEMLEDMKRHEYIDSSAINIDRVEIVGKQNKGSDYIFELLYGFLVPFLFLIPVFLIGSLVIDTISSEIEQKTLHLLLIASNFKKVFVEVVLAAVMITLGQVLIWMLFLVGKGIYIQNHIGILIYVMLFSVFIFLIAVLLSVILKAKTKAQLIYSIVVMGISVTSGIAFFNPVNVIGRLSLGIQKVNPVSYLILITLIVILYFVLARKNSVEELA